MDSVYVKGRIAGRVVSLGGIPIDRASVSFCTQAPPYNAVDQSPMPKTESDSKGFFTLETTSYYRLGYRLLVEKPGWARNFFSVPVIFPNQILELGTVVLSPGQVYYGCVRDLDGQPVRSVQIRISEAIYRTGHSIDDPFIELDTWTDSEGKFVTPPLLLAAGTSLRFYQSGFASEHKWIQVDSVSEPEDLETIVLQPETPCRIHFVEASGESIEGVRVIGAEDGAGGEPVSDNCGIAVIRGLKASERLWFRAIKEGFISYEDHIADWEPKNPIRVVLDRNATISGIVVDAETGELIEIDQIQMCAVERTSATEFDYSSCLLSDFRQPARGVFEIDYSSPGEKHLEIRVAGYQVGEINTPPVEELENQRDIRVSLRRADAANQLVSSKRCIRGRITYRDKPVMHGWVAHWKLEPPCDIAWCNIARGRVVDRYGYDTDYTMINEGQFELTYRPTSEEQYLVIESVGLPTRQVPWSELSFDQETEVVIAMEEPASICGRLLCIPSGLAGHIWVVAFNRTGLRYEVLSDREGRFQFHGLASGTYGLKAGHHGMRDRDIPEIDGNGDPIGVPQDAKSRPWDNAVIISVQQGESIEDIEIPGTWGRPAGIF